MELLQTGFDGLSSGAAFVNACNLYTLTKHGAADEEQLVGAVECAGPPPTFHVMTRVRGPGLRG